MIKKTLVIMALALLTLFLTISFAAEKEKDNKKADQVVIPDQIITDQATEPEEALDIGEKSDFQDMATQSLEGEEINWQVISGGGIINGQSTNFFLSGTVGQTAVGTGTGGGMVLHHGFWQEFLAARCDIAGDANHDGAANVGDAVFLINYVFKGGPEPFYLNEGDANFDCAANVGDAVYLINYVFKGGPGPQCGCVE